MTDSDIGDLIYLHDVQNVANRRHGGRSPAAPVLELVIEGEPIPASRGRSKTGQRPYKTTRMKIGEKALIYELRRAIKGGLAWDRDGNWSLGVIFYRSTLGWVDGDNLVKLLKDAMTKAGVWTDDAQCTHESVTVDLDRERPRTVLRVARHTGTRMVR